MAAKLHLRGKRALPSLRELLPAINFGKLIQYGTSLHLRLPPHPLPPSTPPPPTDVGVRGGVLKSLRLPPPATYSVCSPERRGNTPLPLEFQPLWTAAFKLQGPLTICCQCYSYSCCNSNTEWSPDMFIGQYVILLPKLEVTGLFEICFVTSISRQIQVLF